jgi:hypothetical protein
VPGHGVGGVWITTEGVLTDKKMIDTHCGIDKKGKYNKKPVPIKI